MGMIQKETLKQWHNELNKPDSQKDKNLIVKLVAELRSNNQQLSSLGIVTPIIATIKSIIDKDKKRRRVLENLHGYNNSQSKNGESNDNFKKE